MLRDHVCLLAFLLLEACSSYPVLWCLGLMVLCDLHPLVDLIIKSLCDLHPLVAPRTRRCCRRDVISCPGNGCACDA